MMVCKAFGQGTDSPRKGLNRVKTTFPSLKEARHAPPQVDAFTSQRFCGNPAAVCLIPKGASISDDQMQKIAAENNLAETAYLELVRGHACMMA